jgi:hypothetical protein
MTNLGLDEFAVELGIYFVFLCICMYIMLHQVRGDIGQLKRFFLYRKLEIFPDAARNTNRVANMLLFSSIYYCAAPFLLLIGWFALIIHDRVKEEASLIPAFAILILGAAFIVFGFNLMLMLWNKYQVSLVNSILTLAAFLLLTTYQCLVVFGYSGDEKFLPYSAIFLNFNAMCMAALVFLDKFEDSKDAFALLQAYFKQGPELDNRREVNMQEEVDGQIAGADYQLSFQDLVDIITIYQVNVTEFNSILGSGLVRNFMKSRRGIKLTIKIVLLVLALCLLLAYALLLFFLDNWNKMGIVISICVILMDLFNILIYLSKMIENVATIVFLLVINRILMVVLGEKFWIYGFMFLYVLYAVALLYLVARQNFPLMNEVVVRRQTFAKLAPKIKSNSLSDRDKLDLISSGIQPFYLIVLLTFLYLIFVIIIQFAEFKGKENLEKLYVMEGTTYQKALEPIFACLFSILLVASWYFVMSLIRLCIRKAQKCEQYGASDSKSFLKNKYVDLMSIYMFITWCAIITWACIAYWITDSKFFPVWGTAGAGCCLCFLRAFVYFVINDFEYFQDIKKLNNFIDNHNRIVQENDKKKEEIQSQLASG